MPLVFGGLPPTLPVSSSTQPKGYSWEFVPTPHEAERKMRLSSQHLILASDYFKSALTKGFAESVPESGEFAHVVRAENMNLEALRLVMSIVHGQTHQVPRKISLDLLAKVAVVVDYYKFHKAVDFFFQVWAEQIETPAEWQYGTGFLLRLLVSCIFQEKEMFQKLTKVYLLHSRGPIHHLDLPPLALIRDPLEKARQDLVAKTIGQVHALLQSFYKHDPPCSYNCAAFQFGLLAKGLHTLGLYDPQPQAPFHGFSFDAFQAAVEKIHAPRYTGEPGPGPGSALFDGGRHRQECNLTNKIKPIFQRLRDGIQGLNWDAHFRETVKRQAKKEEHVSAPIRASSRTGYPTHTSLFR
ncbi:uncharacterized protein F5Z01DRAFT_623717 [Emericellopsis atlantica]|uniref:BTB domain-containing protein n=1 Tax=Emericellopsis atlantica TaxID=2614577 RepID=A0A9P7ZL12_9HYPO|nr:uncharacterized protein F5Z01DRAFT_623717 [Emericellopsis atlantica]KAG9253428.1 hypothetical protein F5Z01DRAFT_623717 [Emericellopsis atlantica]